MSARPTIRVADIDASDRLRPVDMDQAATIAASIESLNGTVLQPIRVRETGPDQFRLVVGGHRLAAFGMLGWTELVIGEHVIVSDEDEVDARIAEIDENLARNGLNALDRAIFLAERKKLHEQREGVAGHGGDRRSKAQKHADGIKSQTLRLGFSARFTAEVAERVGLSERTIQLACQLAAALDPETVSLIRGTPLETNQRELLTLAEAPAAEQRKVATAIRDGHAKTVVQARVHVGLDKAVPVDPEARIYAVLLENWERASRQTRSAFLKEIDAQLVSKKGGAK